MEQFIAKIFEMGGVSMVSVGLVYLFLKHDSTKNTEMLEKDRLHDKELSDAKEEYLKLDAETRREYADKLKEVTDDCHTLQEKALNSYIEQIKEIAETFKQSSANNTIALKDLTKEVTEKLNNLHDDLLYFIEDCDCHQSPRRRTKRTK